MQAYHDYLSAVKHECAPQLEIYLPAHLAGGDGGGGGCGVEQLGPAPAAATLGGVKRGGEQQEAVPDGVERSGDVVGVRDQGPKQGLGAAVLEAAGVGAGALQEGQQVAGDGEAGRQPLAGGLGEGGGPGADEIMGTPAKPKTGAG